LCRQAEERQRKEFIRGLEKERKLKQQQEKQQKEERLKVFYYIFIKDFIMKIKIGEGKIEGWMEKNG